MAKLIIQPHGRLNDWVAEEKGYFTEEGLEYELNVEASRKNTPRLSYRFAEPARRPSLWCIRTLRRRTWTQRRGRRRRKLCLPLDRKPSGQE